MRIDKVMVARWVSIVGHPFILTVPLVLLPVWPRSHARAMHITGVIVAVVLIPLGLLIWQRRASGRWETVDASRRSDRPILYFSVFAVMLLLMGYFRFVAQPPIGIQRTVAIALMFGVAALLNRWIKLSLHLAFACFSGLVLASVHLGYGLPILLLVPLLAWSRLVLLRHTIPEIIGGGLLGLITACMMLSLKW
jgi:hypothetical protein